jgi:amino acid permease
MKVRTVVLGLLAVVFLALAVYYVVTPADSLLHFMPGYQAGVTSTHVKHGLAAFVLAVGCGILLWFSTGKKSASADSSDPEE